MTLASDVLYIVEQSLRDAKINGTDRRFDVWTTGEQLVVRHGDRSPYDVVVVKVERI